MGVKKFEFPFRTGSHKLVNCRDKNILKREACLRQASLFNINAI